MTFQVSHSNSNRQGHSPPRPLSPITDSFHGNSITRLGKITFLGSKENCGGKGRGLVVCQDIKERKIAEGDVIYELVNIPDTSVVSTDYFVEFLKLNENLTKDEYSQGFHRWSVIWNSDSEILQVFLKATLPENLRAWLREFLEQNKTPLAVRSSALAEDMEGCSFAGKYLTVFIPNSNNDLEARISELESAIKMVYASTFMQDPKAYMQRLGMSVENAKMAVIIQTVAGNSYGDNYHPLAAGVAFSKNIWPWIGVRRDEGICRMVYGLGTQAVGTGGNARVFVPSKPGKRREGDAPHEVMQHSQQQFDTINLAQTLDASQINQGCVETMEVSNIPLSDNTFRLVTSVHDRTSKVLKDPSGFPDPADLIVTFDSLLKGSRGKLKVTSNGKSTEVKATAILSRLLTDIEAETGLPTDIEFALTVNESNNVSFYLLQMRPQVLPSKGMNINISEIPTESSILRSTGAIGEGILNDIHHIVYVPSDLTNTLMSQEIANQVGELNKLLKQEGKKYILIGPGRWGSIDSNLGIRVAFHQIDGACTIVEFSCKTDPSQGSHFFVNMTENGIFYMNIGNSDFMHNGWLDTQQNHSPLSKNGNGVVLIKLDEKEHPKGLSVAINNEQKGLVYWG